MKKVAIKTAFKTLLILICVALLAFAVASFGFPQHMATLCENLSWYSAAVSYSSLRYSYTGDVSDLARCAEDAILLGDGETVVEYCYKLTSHDDYESLCEQKDEYYSGGDYSEYTQSYNQYIYGKYAKALAQTGEEEQAAEIALSANGLHSFTRGNALASLAIWAADSGSAGLCSLIVDKLGTINVPDSDSEYFNYILQIVTNAAV